MNRDSLAKSSLNCLLCPRLGFHTLGDGCAYAGRKSQKSAFQKAQELKSAIGSIIELFKKDDKKGKGKCRRQTEQD